MIEGPRAAALRAEAARYLPGGTLGMYMPPAEFARVIERGRGSRVWDVDGNEYIDTICGSGALLLGHSHPALVAAVREQLERGSTHYALSEGLVALARELCAAIPCAEAVRFCTTGGEATFYAIRMARAFTGRPKILKFEGGFHGAHDAVVQSLGPRRPPAFPQPAPDSAGIPAGVTADVLVAPFNDLERTAAIVEAHRRELAAVIVEPLQRVIPPVPGFLAGLRELTRRENVLLIFDEIVTGFRLAWGGAQEHYGVVPDLACYGKAVSCGHPLAAVAGRRDVIATSDAGRAGDPNFAWVSGTFNGHALAVAASRAALNELRREGVYPRLHRIGDRLRASAEEIGRRRGFRVKAIGGSSLLQIFFTAREEIRNYRDLLDADQGLAVRFGAELLDRGVHAYPAGKIYLSLAHADEDLAQLEEAFDGAFAALARAA